MVLALLVFILLQKLKIMKYILYSALIIVASCNKTSKSATTHQQEKPDVSKVVISYEATACFGKCPMFTMTINGATQTITYVGSQNVEKLGTYTKHYEVDSIITLVNAFDKAKYFELNNEYLGHIVDFPSVITSYSNYGKTKKIKDRTGGPGELRDLERLLYIISNGEGWKKQEEGK